MPENEGGVHLLCELYRVPDVKSWLFVDFKMYTLTFQLQATRTVVLSGRLGGQTAIGTSPLVGQRRTPSTSWNPRTRSTWEGGALRPARQQDAVDAVTPRTILPKNELGVVRVVRTPVRKGNPRKQGGCRKPQPRDFREPIRTRYPRMRGYSRQRGVCSGAGNVGLHRLLNLLPHHREQRWPST